MRRWQAERVAVGVGFCGESGQAVLLLVAAMAAVLVGAVLLGRVARGLGKGGREQRAADLGALAGARAMREAYARLFEPPDFEGHANPRHLEVGAYEDLGRDAALGVARANGARNVAVGFPDPGFSRVGQPDAVLGNPNSAPFLARQLGRDPPGPQPRMAKREGDDLLLEVRTDLVGHPRPPALAHSQGLQPPAVDLALPAVIGRPIYPHGPTRRRDVAQLVGQREQPQAESDEHVMLRHRLSFHLVWRPGD